MDLGRRRKAGESLTGARMVDVGAKPVVPRVAEAQGRLRLRPATTRAIRAGRLEKGDALEIGRTAAILAAKQTPHLLPLCHPVPLDAVDVSFHVRRDGVQCRVRVHAQYRTGVEMEALVAVTVGLLTVWDLVKPLEKDAHGQYPTAALENVRVVRKVKG